jgi:hypothetical protein
MEDGVWDRAAIKMFPVGKSAVTEYVSIFTKSILK